METNGSIDKLFVWEEISRDEKLDLVKKSIKSTSWEAMFHKLLSGEELSIQDKIDIAKELVSNKVAEILKKEMVISGISWKRSRLNLSSKDCTDPDENIRKFLAILWANDIKVTSDFPWYNETWTGVTYVEFNYVMKKNVKWNI